jgi:ubiquinone/menaquinone biosynthesis C-methylase UbiE
MAEQRERRLQNFWDEEASAYDDAPDHGLADPAIRHRWADLLEGLLPQAGRVLDIGCGTGSLSVLAAQKGHEVVGLDGSSEMLRRARQKAGSAGLDIDFVQGDAAVPPASLGSFEAILGRHILWALPDRAAALRRWTQLLIDGGRMVMIEGFWSTGAGLNRNQVLSALPSNMAAVQSFPISGDRALWGKVCTDERFVVLAVKLGVQ